MVLVGARAGERPVGLAVAAPGPRGQFELLSIFVAPLFRRQGFGAAMLRHVESLFRDLGFRVGVMHTTSLGTQDHIRFLFARGWGLRAIDSVLCRTNLTLAGRTPWLMGASAGSDRRVVAWDEVPADALRRLDADLGPGRAPAIDPFRYINGHEASCSLALLRSTEGAPSAVIGWAITHRIGADTLRWSCSYALSAPRASAAILPLWREVARRQGLLGDCPNFIFSVSMEMTGMVRFARRRMRPWLLDLAHGCTITRAL